MSKLVRLVALGGDCRKPVPRAMKKPYRWYWHIIKRINSLRMVLGRFTLAGVGHTDAGSFASSSMTYLGRSARFCSVKMARCSTWDRASPGRYY